MLSSDDSPPPPGPDARPPEADEDAMDGADPVGADEGRVIESTGSWVMVRVGDETVPSRVRGRMRLGGVPKI